VCIYVYTIIITTIIITIIIIKPKKGLHNEYILLTLFSFHNTGALLACDKNLERALDWIFSRDDLDQAVAEVLSSNHGPSATATAGIHIHIWIYMYISVYLYI
jgi:hypothetical protein